MLYQPRSVYFVRFLVAVEINDSRVFDPVGLCVSFIADNLPRPKIVDKVVGKAAHPHHVVLAIVGGGQRMHEPPLGRSDSGHDPGETQGTQ